MLTISKMFSILCLLCLCWGIGNTITLGRFQNKSASCFLITRVKFCSWPNQRERKVFLEGTNIDLSFKLSLTCGGNVNSSKSVYHPTPSLPVGIGNTEAIFKKISSPFKCVFLLAKVKRRGRTFLEGARKGNPKSTRFS